jgi:hypothetical protein
MTADQYYTKMKGFSSELSALGKPIEEDEFLGYLLHGLDKTEYNSLITTVNVNPGTTLDEFYDQLPSYDMHNGVEENGMFVSSANLAHRGSNREQRSHGHTPLLRGHTSPCGRSPDRGSYHGGVSGGGGYRIYRDDDRGSWRNDERRGDRRDDMRDMRRDDGGDHDCYRRSDGGGRRDPAPLLMSTPNVKCARFMDIQLLIVGGATLMTRSSRARRDRRVHILHPMEWTLTGTLIRVPLITSPVS